MVLHADEPHPHRWHSTCAVLRSAIVELRAFRASSTPISPVLIGAAIKRGGAEFSRTSSRKCSQLFVSKL
jgi:hypothetical protein